MKRLNIVVLSLLLGVFSYQNCYADFFDQLNNVTKRVIKDVVKAGDTLNGEVNGAIKKTNPYEQLRKAPDFPSDTKHYNGNSASVSGHIYGQTVIGSVPSDTAYASSPGRFGVILKLANPESSDVRFKSCQVFILDQFGENVRDPFLQKKWKEYTSLLSDRVRLDNVRTTHVKKQCVFSQLTYLGTKGYASSNDVIGWAAKSMISGSMVTGNGGSNVSFKLKNASYSANQLTTCEHFVLDKQRTTKESENAHAVIGTKVKLTNVRTSKLKRICLFDNYVAIEGRRTNKTNSPKKITTNGNIAFGDVTGVFGGAHHEKVFLHEHHKLTINVAPIVKCNGFFPNSNNIINNLDIKQGATVTLTNVIRKKGGGKVCSFDEILRR